MKKEEEEEEEERKGKERKGKERKGKERKGKERKGKERKGETEEDKGDGSHSCPPLNFMHQDGALSLTKKWREGEGIRIFWDKVREPTFLSRWNPWSTDVPYATFMEHPVKNSNQRFNAICQISTFTTQLVQAVQNAQRKDPVAGRSDGAAVVNEPILIETYTGLMSFLGNRNKLGYSLARGSFGF
ncbi:hypothetical protein JD844_007801 [Phrynosoma platyrhinos]|uniref:Tumor protein p63 regulated 1 n=1 Tax=Phrynosoma platyrhinos TaxID=52577 RepID=A0ABQ7T3Z7_PHRPL|nr:hypothetical protein JD844_007801 [Phrynosoma platyrhinos]